MGLPLKVKIFLYTTTKYLLWLLPVLPGSYPGPVLLAISSYTSGADIMEQYT